MQAQHPAQVILNKPATIAEELPPVLDEILPGVHRDAEIRPEIRALPLNQELHLGVLHRNHRMQTSRKRIPGAYQCHARRMGSVICCQANGFHNVPRDDTETMIPQAGRSTRTLMVLHGHFSDANRQDATRLPAYPRKLRKILLASVRALWHNMRAAQRRAIPSCMRHIVPIV